MTKVSPRRSMPAAASYDFDVFISYSSKDEVWVRGEVPEDARHLDVQSEWCEIENIMTAVLGPANRDLRLLPMLRKDCDKPLRISSLTHIDFAWRQLLTALGAPRSWLFSTSETPDTYTLAAGFWASSPDGRVPGFSFPFPMARRRAGS